ncbi:MAG: glycosyltransferase family 2 protein [Flavobacteriales bacterium]|nr:glycosyltransferase family 2 protein [Flavobacteriales bacterium]
MRVSVVLPVFNKAPFLQECLDSIFAQTHTEFELIAVDDRSTDESLAMLRAITDPRMKVIALDRNLGPAGCAQRGFDAASGEYIVRMDADDVMMPQRIARQVAFMDTHPDIGASGSHMHVLGAPYDLRKASLTDAECRAGVLFQIPVYQPASIYRTSVLREHVLRFKDDWPRYGEDWLFQLRLLQVTRVANVDAVLMQYRVGPQNSTQGRDRRADLAALFAQVLAWYQLPADDRHVAPHLHAVKVYEGGFGAKEVGELRAYLDELVRRVNEQGTFDMKVFGSRVQRVWDDLAYQLPRFDKAAWWAYLRSDRSLSVAKLRYLLSSLLTGTRYEA